MKLPYVPEYLQHQISQIKYLQCTDQNLFLLTNCAVEMPDDSFRYLSGYCRLFKGKLGTDIFHYYLLNEVGYKMIVSDAQKEMLDFMRYCYINETDPSTWLG